MSKPRTPVFPTRLALATLLAPLLLSGCFSIGGDKTTLEVYAPRTTLTANPEWPSLDATVAISEPSASTALDSNRIAVRPVPGRLQVYSGATWSDNAPVLVQSALVSAFDQSGRFKAVSRPTDDVAADLLLQLDLRQFEAVYGEDARRPTVVIELQATLIDQRKHQVLGSRTVRVEQASEEKKLREVVPVFEAALSEAATTLVPWVLEKGAASR
jgi:cholesterol transport system auxiliary component